MNFYGLERIDRRTAGVKPSAAGASIDEQPAALRVLRGIKKGLMSS
jgi:hypothetical protein